MYTYLRNFIHDGKRFRFWFYIAAMAFFFFPPATLFIIGSWETGLLFLGAFILFALTSIGFYLAHDQYKGHEHGISLFIIFLSFCTFLAFLLTTIQFFKFLL